MNNARRKEIRSIISGIEEIKDKLDSIRDDEQEYYDNIPENLQESARAQNSEEAIDSMDNVISSLEDAVGELEEVCSQ